VTLGAVHWIELPASVGHEQSGRRPGVIVQDDAYAAKLPVVFTIPLTTATSTLRFAGTVLVQPSDENGLRSPSVALVFQARAVDRRRIGDRLGSVSAGVLADIFAALDKLTGRRSAEMSD
jgi:mRNA interferase MazF